MTLVISRRSIDWQICDELMDCPAGMTVAVLADELGASPSAISHALYRLEKSGIAVQTSGLARDGYPGRPRSVWKLQYTKRSAAWLDVTKSSSGMNGLRFFAVKRPAA